MQAGTEGCVELADGPGVLEHQAVPGGARNLEALPGQPALHVIDRALIGGVAAHEVAEAQVLAKLGRRRVIHTRDALGELLLVAQTEGDEGAELLLAPGDGGDAALFEILVPQEPCHHGFSPSLVTLLSKHI